MTKSSKTITEQKKDVVKALLGKGILLDASVYKKLECLTTEQDISAFLAQAKTSTAEEIESMLVALFSSQLDADTEHASVPGGEPGSTDKTGHVRVVASFQNVPRKRSVRDFVAHFTSRYMSLQKMLFQRQELSNATSINRVLAKAQRERVSIIGLVKDKQETKRGNILLTLEDLTGEIKAVVTASASEALNHARNIVFDEVLGVVGTTGDGIVFVQSIVWPDVPLSHELKKAPEEVYAVFLSDIHVGSDHFLKQKFEKFLRWLNGEIGTDDQKGLVDKIQYLFIVGDLVDGVGVYPEQDKELEIKDIYDQYEAVVSLLKQVPKRINIIICPGNHDAVRLEEPQPVFYKTFSNPLRELSNVIFVSNPALVNIHASESFSGFDVLLYHGYSFDYYNANVDSIRAGGGYDRPDLVMKYLMQRRHLAPTHMSAPYVPGSGDDSLIIEQVPDFFITGHTHKSASVNYRNITMICGSCWQDTTPFQEKVGHKPEPARVPIVNLETRKTRILHF